MDSKTFQIEMNKLGAFFRTEVSPETMAAYWTRFEQADGTRFQQAVSRCVDARRTFPAVADLLAAMDRIGEERRTATPAGSALPERSQGTVRCLTCFDAKFVRKDVAPGHPDFGERIPCPDCSPAERGRKGSETAAYLAFLERDREIIASLTVYRAEHVRGGAGNTEPLDATPPPDGFRTEVRERAAYVPVPTCMTPFVIVPKVLRGRAGFVGQWADKPERAVRGDACDWRESREAVRTAMVNRYTDIVEVKR